SRADRSELATQPPPRGARLGEERPCVELRAREVPCRERSRVAGVEHARAAGDERRGAAHVHHANRRSDRRCSGRRAHRRDDGEGREGERSEEAERHRLCATLVHDTA
ncbi:MAG: hypothetical protein ACK56I_14180, partial [bacterium]